MHVALARSLPAAEYRLDFVALLACDGALWCVVVCLLWHVLVAFC
jgi:hypothetical protein